MLASRLTIVVSDVSVVMKHTRMMAYYICSVSPLNCLLDDAALRGSAATPLPAGHLPRAQMCKGARGQLDTCSMKMPINMATKCGCLIDHL